MPPPVSLRRASYFKSPLMGCPAAAICTLIWCVRPVSGLIRIKSYRSPFPHNVQYKTAFLSVAVSFRFSVLSGFDMPVGFAPIKAFCVLFRKPSQCSNRWIPGSSSVVSAAVRSHIAQYSFSTFFSLKRLFSFDSRLSLYN